MYQIKIGKKVSNFLKKNKGKDIIYRFERILNILKNNPYSPSLDAKKMVGSNNRYRIRIGKYRLLYKIIDEELVIFLIDMGSRGGIYK